MKAFAIALLVAAPITAGAVEWWEAKSAPETLPQLVAAGYQIVGFTTLAERSTMMDLKVNRYILQKNTSAYICVEKL
ncbi:MAG: hypothetical protein Q8J90_08610, partial [Gallionella sp.]|nr:hypothetical protein [Gallionella sp.]